MLDLQMASAGNTLRSLGRTLELAAACLVLFGDFFELAVS
jgi:hypothetical protein